MRFDLIKHFNPGLLLFFNPVALSNFGTDSGNSVIEPVVTSSDITCPNQKPKTYI